MSSTPAEADRLAAELTAQQLRVSEKLRQWRRLDHRMRAGSLWLNAVIALLGVLTVATKGLGVGWTYPCLAMSALAAIGAFLNSTHGRLQLDDKKAAGIDCAVQLKSLELELNRRTSEPQVIQDKYTALLTRHGDLLV
jgi:hypothetical protein